MTKTSLTAVACMLLIAVAGCNESETPAESPAASQPTSSSDSPRSNAANEQSSASSARPPSAEPVAASRLTKGNVTEARAVLKRIEKDVTRDTIISMSLDLIEHEVALPDIVRFHDEWHRKKENLRTAIAQRSPFAKPLSDPDFRHADNCHGAAINAILEIQGNVATRDAKAGRPPRPLDAPYAKTYEKYYYQAKRK